MIELILNFFVTCSKICVFQNNDELFLIINLLQFLDNLISYYIYMLIISFEVFNAFLSVVIFNVRKEILQI